MAHKGSFSNSMPWKDADRIHRELLAGLQDGWRISFLQDGQAVEMQTLPHGDAKENFPVPAADQYWKEKNWQLLLSPPTDSKCEEILVTCWDEVPRVIMGKSTWKTYCAEEAVRRALSLATPGS